MGLVVWLTISNEVLGGLMGEKFRISAVMVTRVIFTAHATLDGLLGALLFDEVQEVDAAHAAIPLRATDGLFHASAARLLGVTMAQKIGFVAGLRASHDIAVDQIERNKHGEPHKALGLARRSDFGNVANAYTAHAATVIEWTAEGDGGRVIELLQGVHAIGKRRNAGFGEVLNWHIEKGEDDGVVGIDGLVLRPIPVEFLGPGHADVVADAAWRPAYWNPRHRAACYVPSERIEFAATEQAAPA
jgi:hypothetical protein